MLFDYFNVSKMNDDIHRSSRQKIPQKLYSPPITIRSVPHS